MRKMQTKFEAQVVLPAPFSRGFQLTGAQPLSGQGSQPVSSLELPEWHFYLPK